MGETGPRLDRGLRYIQFVEFPIGYLIFIFDFSMYITQDYAV